MTLADCGGASVLSALQRKSDFAMFPQTGPQDEQLEEKALMALMILQENRTL